jgi:protein-disulfide isomerase
VQALLKNKLVLVIAAAAAAVILIGVGLNWWQKSTVRLPGGGGGAVDTAELLKPGPMGEQALGRADAPVTIIEYASMTCGHCANFHTNTYPTLKERYIDTGKVRYIFREFPLDRTAAAAAVLARCAEDRFFPVIDMLFRQQQTWATNDYVEQLKRLMRQAGFSEEKYNACSSNAQLLEGVRFERDRAGEQFGVSSTPTFFVNGATHRGALSVQELEAVLAPLLKG